MSNIRKCDKCGELISLRQMSGGHWVPFEFRTDIPHEHTASNKKKGKPNSKKKKIVDPDDPTKIVDRSNNVYLLGNLLVSKPATRLDLTPVNLIKLSKWSIKNQKTLKIVYCDRHEEMTTRKIYPLKIVDHDARPNESSSKKLSAWCTLREEYRTFLISGIEEILPDTAIPVSFQNKFKALKASEKKRILSGETGFAVSQKKKNQVPLRSIIKKETNAQSPSYNTNTGRDGDVSNSGSKDLTGCLFWVVIAALFIWFV